MSFRHDHVISRTSEKGCGDREPAERVPERDGPILVGEELERIHVPRVWERA